MKTHVIRIPSNQEKNAETFRVILENCWESLMGETLSLEFVSTGQNIACCFTAKESISKAIIGLVYAAVPNADIIEVPDFTSKLGRRIRFQSSEIGLSKSELFPLKTFEEIEGCSISALLSVLSQCGTGERIFFQIVIKPEKDIGIGFFKLGYKKYLDKIKHIFRVRYWFRKKIKKELKSAIDTKMTSRLWKTNIRIGALTNDPDFDPGVRLKALLGALTRFNTRDMNQLKPGPVVRLISLKDFQKRSLDGGFLLSSKEIATMFHLPTERHSSNVLHVLSKKGAPPAVLPIDVEDSEIAFFALSNFRNQRIPFGIKLGDRRRHMLCLGKTGMGKSKLIELLIKNDLYTKKKIAVMDPQGDLVDSVLKIIPKHRVEDVILLDFSREGNLPKLNMFTGIKKGYEEVVSFHYLKIIKSVFPSEVLDFELKRLLDLSIRAMCSLGLNFKNLVTFLKDDAYRVYSAEKLENETLRNFWIYDYPVWSQSEGREAKRNLLSKIIQLMTIPSVNKMFSDASNSLDFENILTEDSVFLVKLPEAFIGKEGAKLLFGMFLVRLYLMSSFIKTNREDVKQDDFFVYLDDFMDYVPDSFGDVLKEARRNNLSFVLTNQFIGSKNLEIRDSLLGNIGNLICFRVGANDAEIISPEFQPRFNSRDLLNLGVRNFLIKMSINGEMKEAFSARTLMAVFPDYDFSKQCREASVERFNKIRGGTPLTKIENVNIERPELDEVKESNEDKLLSLKKLTEPADFKDRNIG